MKKILFATLMLSLVATVTSCNKWEKGKEKTKADYYYSTDFKEAENTILGHDIEDIDVLYSTFFYEGKMLKYKLIAKETDKEDCFDKCGSVLAYEEGEAVVTDELNITFIPDANPTGAYEGYFENDKKNYQVSLPGIAARELSFIIKK